MCEYLLKSASFLFFCQMLHTTVDAVFIDDIKKAFGNNPCIQGSLASISNKKESLYTLEAQGSDDVNLLRAEDTKASILTEIYELAQYNNLHYFYELENEEGPDHQKVFTIKLVLGNEKYVGTGTSLKNAQRQAAGQALEKTEYEFPPDKEKEVKSLTPTVLLSNFAAQVGLLVEYFLVTHDIEVSLNSDLPPEKLARKSYLQKLNESIYLNSSLHFRKDETNTKGPFKVKVVFDGQKFIGTDHTIQGAKHQAAKKALKHAAKLIEEGNLECIQGNSQNCKKAKDNIKSPISKIHEAAQWRNLEVSFEIVKESGPAHKKTFVTECRVGGFTTTGEGKSKKESKSIAAKNMLENLPDLPELNSESVIGSYVGNKNKKRKKNKDKIIKTNFDKLGLIVGKVLKYGSNIMSSKNNNDKSGKKPSDSVEYKKDHTTKSPQNEMLELSNMLNLEVDFTDLESTSDKFYSVLTVHLKPSFICFGEGPSQKTSRDTAAKSGLKLIKDLGLLDKLNFQEKVQTEDESVQEHLKIWLPFSEETD